MAKINSEKEKGEYIKRKFLFLHRKSIITERRKKIKEWKDNEGKRNQLSKFWVTHSNLYLVLKHLNVRFIVRIYLRSLKGKKARNIG